MASPQLENGYVKIANELFDQYIRFRMPREVRMVCDFIIRKTYGFNKREDTIALKQFALALRLKRPSVVRAIKKAILMNIVSRRANDNSWKYRFNKDFEHWKPLAAGLIVSRRANASLAAGLHTKDTTTKDNMPSPTAPAKIKVKREPYRGLESKKILSWGYKQFEDGKGFTNPGVQMKAIQAMLRAGFSEDDIKDQWVWMASQKYWQNGFDFTNVAKNIHKSRVK